MIIDHSLAEVVYPSRLHDKSGLLVGCLFIQLLQKILLTQLTEVNAVKFVAKHVHRHRKDQAPTKALTCATNTERDSCENKAKQNVDPPLQLL